MRAPHGELLAAGSLKALRRSEGLTAPEALTTVVCGSGRGPKRSGPVTEPTRLIIDGM
jgi:hypothetical protein